MEKMSSMLKSGFAIIGTICTFIFGGWDTVLIILVIFLCLDYLSGITVAVVEKNLSSKISFNGILKKMMVIAVLIVAIMLDRFIVGNAWVFRTLVCYFYISNEGISILENIAKLGIPIPKKILEILRQIKN